MINKTEPLQLFLNSFGCVFWREVYAVLVKTLAGGDSLALFPSSTQLFVAGKVGGAWEWSQVDIQTTDLFYAVLYPVEMNNTLHVTIY